MLEKNKFVEIFSISKSRILLTIIIAIIIAVSIPLFPCTIQNIALGSDQDYSQPQAQFLTKSVTQTFVESIIPISLTGGGFKKTCSQLEFTPIYLLIIPYILASIIHDIIVRNKKSQRKRV